jgi:hypothetical protein
MERELVESNLEVIKEAVIHHKEILIDRENEDRLHSISKKAWDDLDDQRAKDRTKFVISKTIAFSPSVLEEDMEVKNAILSISAELITYFQNRQMTPIAELLEEYIKNERSKDSLLSDYNYKEGF